MFRIIRKNFAFLRNVAIRLLAQYKVSVNFWLR